MKVYVVPKGTKVALGNGDGNFKIFTTTREMSFSNYVCDPIYYWNQKFVHKNSQLIEEICQDPIIKSKHNTVAKYPLNYTELGVLFSYKFLYVDYRKVKILK